MLSISDEQQLIERLLVGDEHAFVDLIRAYHTPMCKLASLFISDAAMAEEVVQETWLVVIDSLHRFEARSSLKTWLWGILVNKAKKRAVRESRQIAWGPEQIEASIGKPADAYRYANNGHWNKAPGTWHKTPEDELIQSRILELVHRVMDTLPPQQKIVLTMRDVQGFTAREVCEVLDISQSHHRVLLHRARAAIREAIDQHEQPTS